MSEILGLEGYEQHAPKAVLAHEASLQKTNLRIDEAAALLEVHQNTVRRWLAAGKLKGTRGPGGGWRVPMAALKPYL